MSRILIYDNTFPYSGVRPDYKSLQKLSQYFKIITASDEVPSDAETIVNLHGAYFPRNMWRSIKTALLDGASFINIGGGTPVSYPVSYENGVWRTEKLQTEYHRQLYIQNTLEIEPDRIDKIDITDEFPVLRGYEKCFSKNKTSGYVVMFTHKNDVPTDSGTAGPMDAAIFPLIKGYFDNRHTASPVMMIEHYKHDFMGARHMYIAQDTTDEFWANGGADVIKILSDIAELGSYEIRVRPNYALYLENERPTLLINSQKYKKGKNTSAKLSIEITKADKLLYNTEMTIPLEEDVYYTQIPLSIDVEPGFYTLKYVYEAEGEVPRTFRNGFWGRDTELLKSRVPLTCDKDYFCRGETPSPITGMTYMQSDIARKYIYLPNPYLWDIDFAELKRAGVNYIRTGFWTAFRHMMFVDGYVEESVLRFIEAMAHTASYHDIPLCINLFAFIPELFEGINSYYDPRSLEGQKRFVTSFVSRLKDAAIVHWDLINEPSVCNPDKLWSTRPNGDKYELAAWHEFLKERHGTIDKLTEHWNVPCDRYSGFDDVPLPDESCFNENPAFAHIVNTYPAWDYYLFNQYTLNQWIKLMYKTIRKAGSNALITVGQDETIGTRRPEPLFMKDELDYVCNHSWWKNDLLYLDGVMAKPSNKPMLIQETGIMYTQNVNGKNRREMPELRNILERKYAYALATGGAGAVHWIWNTNCYMDNNNEAHIGALLPDGTHKLEADVSYMFGDFGKSCGSLLKNRKACDIAVIMPVSSYYSSRDYGLSGIINLCRVMAYNKNVHFDMVNEFDTAGYENYKLIIVPSPRIISDAAFDKLYECAEKGACVIISGPICEDEYYENKPNRAEKLDVYQYSCNAAREEYVDIQGEKYCLTYGGDSLAYVDKASADGKTADNIFREIKIGKGAVLWCSLPVELSGNECAMEKIYSIGMNYAGISDTFRWNSSKNKGIMARRLDFENAYLYIFVSETGENIDIDVTDTEMNKTLKFKLESQRAAMFMFENGKLVKSYRDLNIDIK